MYETKLRKHEREYPHPKESEIRETVRYEFKRMTADFIWLLIARFLLSIFAALVAFFGILMLVELTRNGQPVEQIKDLAVNMASIVSLAAFFVVFLLWRWKE